MSVQLPKPLHGWREFAGEVGIIVLGVLLALGAQQAAEAIHDRREADKSMEAIRAELAHSAGVFDERSVAQHCIDRRLDELDQVFASARRTGRLPDVGEIGRPPVRPIQSSAWESAGVSQTLSDFDDKQRDALSLIYSQASTFWSDVVDEQSMWATMRLMEHAPGPIDDAMLTEIGGTLARLRFRSFLNGVDANQLLASIEAESVQPDYAITNEVSDIHRRGAMLTAVHSRPLCRPLSVDGRPLDNLRK